MRRITNHSTGRKKALLFRTLAALGASEFNRYAFMRSILVNSSFLLASIFCASGCVSQVPSFKKHIESNVGEPIDRIRSTYTKESRRRSGLFQSENYSWVENVSTISNGDIEYSYTNPYLDCQVIWVTDRLGTIISGSYSGEEC